MPTTIAPPVVTTKEPLCQSGVPFLEEDGTHLELTGESPCAIAASPNFGTSNYPNVATKRNWYWYSSEATKFKVKFVEEFEIHKTKKCKRDFLKIFRGGSTSGT